MANLSALLAQRSAALSTGRDGEVRSRRWCVAGGRGVCSRGSKDCLCSGSLLEMSDPSRSAFSQASQGKGCFYSQLGGTQPFHLQGSLKFLRNSWAGAALHWCCHGAQSCLFPEEVARQAAVLCLFGLSLAQIIYIHPALSRNSSPECPREHFPCCVSVTERKNSPKLQVGARGQWETTSGLQNRWSA